MGAPRKYTEFERTEALKLYETEGPSAVEKKLGIPKGTVTRWAKQDGIETVSVDRTRAGTEAAAVYSKARREQLKGLLLDDAHRLRKQLWEPARLVNFGGKDNTLNEVLLEEPLFVDKKNILSAVGIAVDRVVKLDQLDNDSGVDAGKSMLEKLAEQLGAMPVVDPDVGESGGGGESEAAALPSDE